MNPEYVKFFSDVLTPILASCVLGSFIFTALKFVLGDVITSVRTLASIVMALENRVKTCSHELIKIDVTISSVLGLRPDLDRISRMDGKNDARRD
ncbi:hypothetical protein UFOVP1655_59 [uncultured Caudovirales phage]|jgi:hypothetical protein|uniref:Uncharacterized protein n=1 Tax=uncultured Caudovirales phage TaxID=2100421 RepID=A0A6J5T5U6_9CAUD|nr:hypothetical protein UFOVP1655_59 [uncultured Caudovirales phage]